MNHKGRKIINFIDKVKIFYIFVVILTNLNQHIYTKQHLKNWIMKTHYSIILMVVLFISGLNTLLPAQDNTTVPQVIIGIGGRFESNAPYFDYVNVASYDPASHAYTIFDTIYTQSIQDVLVSDHYAFVAAQDSIVKYDLNTLQRIAAVADSGMDKLGLFGDKLIVSKGFPVKRFFVEILDANTLALFSLIDNISGDCAGVLATSDSVYVAVNGGYQGTEGKVAVISPASWTLTHEINFGTDAVGIWSLFGYGGFIYAVNSTQGGSSTIGSITKCDIFSENFTNNILNVTVGYGIGIQGTLLYAMFNNGIGSYDLNTDLIADTNIVRDPGSSHHVYIMAAALDYVNNNFYFNVGNYTSNGKGIETTILGDSITAFNEGISANAIGIEFLTPTGISSGNNHTEIVTLSPNPVNNSLKVNFKGQEQLMSIKILDITGRTIYSSELKGNEKSVYVNSSSFPSGIYFLSLNTNNGTITKKLIKQ
jgi:hypothetical protein